MIEIRPSTFEHCRSGGCPHLLMPEPAAAHIEAKCLKFSTALAKDGCKDYYQRCPACSQLTHRLPVVVDGPYCGECPHRLPVSSNDSYCEKYNVALEADLVGCWGVLLRCARCLEENKADVRKLAVELPKTVMETVELTVLTTVKLRRDVVGLCARCGLLLMRLPGPGVPESVYGIETKERGVLYFHTGCLRSGLKDAREEATNAGS